MGIKTGYTNGAGYSVVSAAQARRRDAVRDRAGDDIGPRAVSRGEGAARLGIRPLSPAWRSPRRAQSSPRPRCTDYLDVTVPAAVLGRRRPSPVLDLNGTDHPHGHRRRRCPHRSRRGRRVGVATFRQGEQDHRDEFRLVATDRRGEAEPLRCGVDRGRARVAQACSASVRHLAPVCRRIEPPSSRGGAVSYSLRYQSTTIRRRGGVS